MYLSVPPSFQTQPLPNIDYFPYFWDEAARLHQEGLKGLVDRRQGKPYKATEEVKRYIKDIKIKDHSKTPSDISVLVEKRYHKSLSERHIRRILEEFGLNDSVGRKAGKHKIKKTGSQERRRRRWILIWCGECN